MRRASKGRKAALDRWGHGRVKCEEAQGTRGWVDFDARVTGDRRGRWARRFWIRVRAGGWAGCGDCEASRNRRQIVTSWEYDKADGA